MKLVHQCEVLQNCLKECRGTLFIEEEDKLTIDTPSPSNAVELFTTSNKQIGLLVAEVSFMFISVSFVPPTHS